MAKDDVDIGRLCRAVQRARLVLRKPRQERVDMVRQYVGQHWSEEGTALPVPCNLIGLFVTIVGRKLIANNPRAMMSTFNRQAKPVVSAMETWANMAVEEMHLANTLQRVVLDALFSIGIAKVALAGPGDAALSGWASHAGKPFCERVDLDDFVYDIHCRDFSEAGFMGHRVRVPLRAIRESKIFSKDRKDLSVSEDRIYNMEGDERISLLGRTTLAGSDTEEFEDMVDLWEIYLPRHRLVLTLRDDNLSGAYEGGGNDPNYGKALRIQNWLGPDCGPYHILGFGHVPGNPMPKAPIQDLYDLHMAINRIMRKLIRQADRTKQLLAVGQGRTEDGTRILNADDGDIIPVTDITQVNQIVLGAPNQELFQLFLAFKEIFSWMSGNLDIMGGLSPQSKTAHQDEMLNQNSSATLAEMQDRTITMVTGVIQSLCWYWHHDPISVHKSNFTVPGLPDFGIQRNVYPNNPEITGDPLGKLVRSMSFEEMQVKIDPYSLQHQTPQQRLQFMNQVIQQVGPLLQMLQSQGINLDANKWMQLTAKYGDSPDLADIFTIQEPVQDTPSGGSEGPGMPAETSREYVRRSIGNSPEGKETQLMQDLMTKKPESNGTPQGAGIGG